MAYAIADYTFSTSAFFPDKLFAALTDLRVQGITGILAGEAKTRQRRPSITLDGKLTILAADHPARMVTAVGGDPLAMGNRYDYLGRVLRVITDPTFDGLMATPDVLEDVFLVNYLHKQQGGKSFLDNKVLLGSMNRGGLSGSVWELDDRFTAYTAEGISAMRLDGGKLVLRIDVGDAGCCETIDATSQAIDRMAELGLPIFVEALVVERGADGKPQTKKDAAALIKAVSVGAALGTTSAYTWLKIPYCDGFASVARSTTMPILLLGGEAKADPTPVLREFVSGMAAGPSVRGALVGRNVLYPGTDDPLAMALAVHGIVHHGDSVEQALSSLNTNRGRHLDVFRLHAR